MVTENTAAAMRQAREAVDLAGKDSFIVFLAGDGGKITPVMLDPENLHPFFTPAESHRHVTTMFASMQEGQVYHVVKIGENSSLNHFRVYAKQNSPSELVKYDADHPDWDKVSLGGDVFAASLIDHFKRFHAIGGRVSDEVDSLEGDYS